ncbi:PH domain-containing protein [Propioniciclava flava]|uniref:Membrane-flanked domain protein n=1 Tax=Propioniciclava flava TaxID=2072026 RepID=A0A4Q2EIJ2_9ACTN|nr:PH domain-containing protein [Propioniciclava flava]RXW33321.1 membrane-flanked domain protein [Propioniciclava flava]
MVSLSRFLRPEASRRLLVDEGEFIVDEVSKHWVCYVLPSLLVVAGIGFSLLMPLLGPGWWVALVAALGAASVGFYRIHAEFMDRFLITNMRVFRVHGIVDQHMATMPIARILDISVRQTLPGQLLGYGHFVFESAAQDQGLKQINFVPRIEQRDLTIQRVIQRAGLRARMEAPADWDGI